MLPHSTRTRSLLLLALSLSAAALPAARSIPQAGSATVPAQRPAQPPAQPPDEPDCKARVGFDRNMVLPGFLLPTAAGPRTCIPFSTSRFHPPAGYPGDFYIEEFTDAKLRERWEACRIDKPCYDRVSAQIEARVPPNREHNLTDPHARFLLGKIDENGDATDLKQIRRPSFFARPPYFESIAQDDAQASIVEFSAPPEPYEVQRHLVARDVKLRGWYLRGAGVQRGAGSKVRSLVIMSGGGGDRVAAIEDPAEHAYIIDPKTGDATSLSFPSANTGFPGLRAFREVAHALHQAGFDVLLFDRRGVGVSSGYSDTNTLQQGRDLLQIVRNLRDGEGLRVLARDGRLRQGKTALAVLQGGGRPATRVFLLGSSRGTMVSSWAMTMNFDRNCTYDAPQIACTPAVHDTAIKGVMLLSDFSSGPGYVPAQMTPQDAARGLGADRGLFIGGTELQSSIVFFPSSAILAGIPTWPNAFFACGLWDYADSLEGEIASYRRVRGLKELVVVRGPHPFDTWPAEERQRVLQRMIAFGKAALAGQKTVAGGRSWSTLKQLVGTAGDFWEPSTHPQQAAQEK